MMSYCPTCRELVPSGMPLLHSGVFLTKNCPDCGISMVKIESDPDFFHQQELLPRTTSQNDCYMIDITGQCDAGCRSCYHHGGEHRTIDQFAADLMTVPTGSRVLISGGEPLQHHQVTDFVSMAATAGMHPILLTNGAGLTAEVYQKLLDNGLMQTDTPQIAVSLGIPGSNHTFPSAFTNLKERKVADVAFTISKLSELALVEQLANTLRGQYDAICIRTAWNGVDPGLYLSDIVQTLDGKMVLAPTLHGYRNAMVEKNGIIYKILSWPTWQQYDAGRYTGRGVWYRGDNVVNTLVRRYVASM